MVKYICLLPLFSIFLFLPDVLPLSPALFLKRKQTNKKNLRNLHEMLIWGLSNWYAQHSMVKTGIRYGYNRENFEIDTDLHEIISHHSFQKAESQLKVGL